MPLPELTQRSLGDDLHERQLACSQNGNKSKDVIRFVRTLTEHSDPPSTIHAGHGGDRKRRIEPNVRLWNGKNAPTPPGSSYGYARVSMTDQDLTVQYEALGRAGCRVIRTEKVSGTSVQGRQELRTLLDFIRDGDELVALVSIASRALWPICRTSSVS